MCTFLYTIRLLYVIIIWIVNINFPFFHPSPNHIFPQYFFIITSHHYYFSFFFVSPLSNSNQPLKSWVMKVRSGELGRGGRKGKWPRYLKHYTYSIIITIIYYCPPIHICITREIISIQLRDGGGREIVTRSLRVLSSV